MVGQKRGGRGRGRARGNNEKDTPSKNGDFEGFDSSENESLEPTSARSSRLRRHLTAINSPKKLGEDIGKVPSTNEKSTCNEEVSNSCKKSLCQEANVESTASEFLTDQESIANKSKMVYAAVNSQHLSSEKTSEIHANVKISTSLPLPSESDAPPLEISVAPEELGELDDGEDTEEHPLTEKDFSDAAFETNTSHGAEHQSMGQSERMPSTTHENIGTPPVRKEMGLNEWSKNTTSKENSSIKQVVSSLGKGVSNEFSKKSTNNKDSTIGKWVDSNKLSKHNSIAHSVPQSTSVALDPPIKIAHELPEQPAGAKVVQNEKKFSKKFGEEFILVTVPKGVSPAQGQHECVLCLPGKPFLPKELLFHMRSLQHLKHMLELLNFESFMKHKQSNNAEVFVNRLSQMLGGNSIPKKVHVVRPEAAEETRSKLKLGIQELREQSRKIWREKQCKTSVKIEAAATAASAPAAANVEGALKHPLIARTCDGVLPAQHPVLEKASVEAVSTFIGTKKVLQLVLTNLECTVSDENASKTSFLPTEKYKQVATTANQQEVTKTTILPSNKPVHPTNRLGAQLAPHVTSSITRATASAPTTAEKSCGKANSVSSRLPSSLPQGYKPVLSKVAEGLNSRIVSQPPSVSITALHPLQNKKVLSSGRGEQAKTTQDGKLVAKKKALSIKTEEVGDPEKDNSKKEKKTPNRVEDEPEVIVVEKQPSPPKEHPLIVLDEDEDSAGQDISLKDSSNGRFSAMVSPFPLQSGGTKRVSSNDGFSDFVSPLPLQSGGIQRDFDHIIIMGDCKQLKSSRQWNYKKTTFFDVGNSLLGSSLPKLNMMKSNLPRRSLWIFLADVGMVCGAVDVKESICQKAYCSMISTSPLPDYRFVSQINSSSPATELNSKTIQNLVHLRLRAFNNALDAFRSVLPRSACIMMLPLMPRKVHCTLSDCPHLSLHDLYDKEPDILFTSGHAGNFLRAVRILDLNWRMLAGNFHAPHNLKSHIMAFTNIPNDPFRVTLSIENSEKAYSHIYNWYKMAWSLVDKALGDTPTIPKEMPVRSHGKVSMKQFLNSSEEALNLLLDRTSSSSQSVRPESPSSMSLSVPSSRLALACALDAQPSLGQWGVEPPRLVVAPPVPSSNDVGGRAPAKPKGTHMVQPTPDSIASNVAPKPLFPSAEMIIRMPPPVTSKKYKEILLGDQKRSPTLKVASSRKSSTDEKPSVKKHAQLPVTAFPCLDISNGFPVFTSNIPKDVSVMLMKKIFLAIGEFSDYRLETNHDDSTTCLSTTVYTKKECASTAIRVLAKLSVNKYQLGVFSSHVSPPVDEWDSNELLIKYRVIRILNNANKTFDWDSKDTPTDEKAERDWSSKQVRSRSPLESRMSGKSRSPTRQMTLSSARKTSKSPINNKSRSPVRRRTRSPVRKRSRSPVRRRTRSPVRRRTRSPIRRMTRSPVRRRTRSPIRRSIRSPIRRKSRSPARKRSRSPGSRSGQSPSFRRRTISSPSRKRRSSDGRTSRASNGSGHDRAVSVVAEVVSSLTAHLAGTGDPNTVIINSGSTNLTRLFVTEVHQLFNGFFLPIVKPRIGWLLQLGDSRQAQLLVQVMNNLRLADTVVTARLDGPPEGREIRIIDAEVEKHRARIQKCCKDYDNRALVLIQEQINKEMDVYTFKVEPCTTQNCPRIRCLGYHDNKERRRNILKHSHTVEMCPTALSGTSCPHYDLCRYAHTANEALLHPSLFLRDICPRMTPDGRCTNLDFCIDSHPGTPDMLYHATWQDLYVSGLENSYFFLIGAIRNLFGKKKPVPGYGHITRVMFVTPCPDVARYAHDLITNLANKHGISVAPLNTLNGEIVIGSVAALFSHVMSVSHRCFGRLVALVLDDISGLLSPTHCRNINSLVLKTFKEIKSTGTAVNRVVVCSEVREYEVAAAKKLLNTTFKVISKERLSKVVPAKNSNYGGANRSRWDPPASAARTRQESARQDVEASRPPHQGSFVDAPHRPVYPAIARPNGEFPRSSRAPYQEVASSSGGGHHEPCDAWPPAAPRHQASASLLAPSSLAAASDSPARLYISEKEMLMQELEDKYRIYADTPARHPRCREFFDTFAALPNKDELDWKDLWINELDIMKADEYQERMVQLVKKFKKMANNSVKPAESSGPYSAYNHLVLPRNDDDVRNQSDGASTWKTGAAAQSYVRKAGSAATSSTWRDGTPADELDPRASSWRSDAAQDRAQGQGGSWLAETNNTEMTLRRSLDAIVASPHSDQRAQDAASWGGANRGSSLDEEPLQSDMDGRRWPSNGRASFTRPATPPPPPIIRSTSSDSTPPNNKTDSSSPSYQSTFTEYNPASPTSSPPPPSSPPFDLEEVFSLLEHLAPSLGVLTPAMTSLVAVARRRSATSSNALDLFMDKEIVNVLSLALNNFNDQMQTASAQRYPMLKRAVVLGEQLMLYSREHSVGRK